MVWAHQELKIASEYPECRVGMQQTVEKSEMYEGGNDDERRSNLDAVDRISPTRRLNDDRPV